MGGNNVASFKLEFETLDNNKSGFIEPKEVSRLFMGYLPEKLVKKVLDYVDTNKDGKIDFQEYTKIREQLAKLNIGRK